ncbi:MAG: ATP-binding protein, partial [Lachnospiraceae bacterium]|nr:ATP-binding protein [Lachnospiraceae bacterium]
MKDKKLLLFGNTEKQPILHEMCALLEEDAGLARKKAPACLHAFLSMAGQTGFYGNLWNVFLTHILVLSENSYTLSAECAETPPSGTVRAFALHDLAYFHSWMTVDLYALSQKTDVPEFRLLADYHAETTAGREYNAQVRESICSLAVKLAACPDPEAMLTVLDDFYQHYGVGTVGLHKAFRLDASGSGCRIVPVARIAEVGFDDLVGYEDAKTVLRRNTEAFLKGAPANNCLLYGDAGTGKSTSIKALANTYYGKGLRIIEIYRHEFQYLNEVISQIKHRNYRFILYMDDLSFEEFETEYKYLKAVIEGGLEKKPDNVLIYVTSNRRHLIRETFGDKQKLSDDDVHRSDTVQEKLSLYDRFGVTIYYGSPSPAQYQEIVKTLAKREGIRMPEKELLLLANPWELKHAG